MQRGDRSDAVDLVAIAAVAENGVIGRDGEEPWDHPADLQHFHRVTTGHPVIVGRVTYESIVERTGGPLPDRDHIVLSKSLDAPAHPQVEVVRARSEAIAQAQSIATGGVAFIIGGASVYEQFLDMAAQMILTEIPESPEGDAYFPTWDTDIWTEVNRISVEGLSVVSYART